MIEVPYNYIFLCMFNSLQKFGCLDSVSEEDVYNYVTKFLEFAKENAKELGKPNIKFNEYDIESEIDSFVRDYSDYFYKHNGRYYIADDIDYRNIENDMMRLGLEGKVNDIFRVSTESINLLKTIHATYTYKEFVRLLKFEMMVEKRYIDYVIKPTKEKKEELKKLLFMRQINIENLKNMPEYYFDAVYLTTIDFIDKFDISYDKYPIDNNLWNVMPHITEINSGELFYDMPQYAIFGDKSLGFKKIEKDIDKIFDANSGDPLGIISLFFSNKNIDDKIKEVVYLKYISNINDYIDKYGEDEKLLRVKARLMYAIDNVNLCIYDDKEMSTIMSNLKAARLNAVDIYKLADEARFLTGELFITSDLTHAKEKLLLMKTYYDLTQDESYKELFDTFKDFQDYDTYREVVFGKNRTLKK